MRQVITIALLQFRQILRNVGYLVMMFAMPLAFTGIFGLIMSGGDQAKPQPVAVVDTDGSFASAKLVAALKADSTLQVKAAAAARDVDVLMADRQIQAGLVIPHGFQQALENGSAPEVQVIPAPGGDMDLAARPALSRAVALVTENYRLARQVAGSADESVLGPAYAQVETARQTATVATVPMTAGSKGVSGANDLQDRAVGMSVMFVMLIVLMLSGVILQERQTGTWGRILTSPTRRLHVMGGYLLSFFLTGAFQFTVLVVASKLLFRVQWGPVLPLVAVAGAMILCASGLGLLLAGLVRTAEQQRSLGLLVVIATSMLGGVMWPLDLMPSAMQTIGRFTPQAWAMEGMKEIMLRGAHWSALGLPLAVLAGMAVLFTGVGILRIRWE